MKNFKLKFFLFFLLTLSLFLTNPSFSNASSSGIDVNLKVGGECNNNGICEKGQEDMFSCPLDCVPPPIPDHGGSSGSLISNYFNDLTVEVSYNNAIIRWKSDVPTISNFKWGTNPDYRDGSLQNINFLLDHKVELNNLKDGTIYYFSIQSVNYYGVIRSLESQTFKTLSLPDVTPPGNPTNVKATTDPSGITLSWNNPKDEDFDYVRILRNDDRYYSSPSIGKLIYEGNNKYFTDSNVVEGHKYYYSLFSRDRAGNYSSGSLISIIHNPQGLDNWGTELEPAKELKPIPNLFIVTQNSSTYDFYPGNIFHLSGDVPINIKTNFSSKIKNDDMWVEIRNSDGVIIGQYFFDRTRDKDNFINVIIPIFERGGYYNLMIYKYTNGISQLVNYGSFDITKVGEKVEGESSRWYIFLFIIFILLFLILLCIFIRKKILKHLENRKIPLQDKDI